MPKRHGCPNCQQASRLATGPGSPLRCADHERERQEIGQWASTRLAARLAALEPHEAEAELQRIAKDAGPNAALVKRASSERERGLTGAEAKVSRETTRQTDRQPQPSQPLAKQTRRALRSLTAQRALRRALARGAERLTEKVAGAGHFSKRRT